MLEFIYLTLLEGEDYADNEETKNPDNEFIRHK